MKPFPIALSILLALTLISGSLAESTNLIQNPGAEIGWGAPDHWTTTGQIVYSDEGYSGLHSFGLHDYGTWESEVIVIDSSKIYNFSFWVKGEMTSGTFFIHLREWSNENGTGWIDQLNFLISGDYANWTFVKDESMEFPSNMKSLTVQYCNESSAEGLVYVDDYCFKEVLDTPWYQEIFTELLFGSGSWIGLTLIVVLLLLIGFINKYGGMVSLPIAVLLFIEYTVQGLGWHGIIVFLVGMIGILNSSYQLKSKK